ncbi:hypothetical protein WJX84_009836 [Apatococcus fuscideae]|uniref:Uncharacterized protein n=1 Tax=Apatococcus fuscideae TaxID=2026836 RepID=A0AAW1SMW1_9CHLO
MHASLQGGSSTRPFSSTPASFSTVRPHRAGARKGVPWSTSTLAVAQPDTFALTVSSLDAQYYREVDLGNRPDLNTAAPGDFYELLGLEANADAAAVRAAYRALQRIVHPDIIGDSAHELAILMNSAYATLSDVKARQLYDDDLRHMKREVGTFDGRPVSAWQGGPDENRALFVDETACIGCRQCTGICPDTFAMEDDYGRARVTTQWADDAEYVSEAIDLCPLDCISYVPRDQLALLEFVMKSCKREDPAILARRRSGNMGTAPNKENPFDRARVFLKRRKEAKLSIESGSAKRTHDETLSAAIARAWIALPHGARQTGWPSWMQNAQAIPY